MVEKVKSKARIAHGEDGRDADGEGGRASERERAEALPGEPQLARGREQEQRREQQGEARARHGRERAERAGEERPEKRSRARDHRPGGESEERQRQRLGAGDDQLFEHDHEGAEEQEREPGPESLRAGQPLLHARQRNTPEAGEPDHQDARSVEHLGAVRSCAVEEAEQVPEQRRVVLEEVVDRAQAAHRHQPGDVQVLHLVDTARPHQEQQGEAAEHRRERNPIPADVGGAGGGFLVEHRASIARRDRTHEKMEARAAPGSPLAEPRGGGLVSPRARARCAPVASFLQL